MIVIFIKTLSLFYQKAIFSCAKGGLNVLRDLQRLTLERNEFYASNSRKKICIFQCTVQALAVHIEEQ